MSREKEIYTEHLLFRFWNNYQLDIDYHINNKDKFSLGNKISNTIRNKNDFYIIIKKNITDAFNQINEKQDESLNSIKTIINLILEL